MRYLNIYLFIFMLLFFSENIRSQNFKNSKNFDTGYIKGKIKNTNDKNLEFATVSLYNVKDNMLVEGTITNSKGKFLFTNVSVGKYRINISFIGYKDETMGIHIQSC